MKNLGTIVLSSHTQTAARRSKFGPSLLLTFIIMVHKPSRCALMTDNVKHRQLNKRKESRLF
jgi:hypothetical protein